MKDQTLPRFSEPVGFPWLLRQTASFTLASLFLAFLAIQWARGAEPSEPTIAWSPSTTITYGALLDSNVLNATAMDVGSGDAVPGSYTYTPPAGTRLDVGNAQTISVRFDPADTNAYLPVNATVTINVVYPGGSAELFVSLLAGQRIQRYTMEPQAGGALQLSTEFPTRDPSGIIFDDVDTLWVANSFVMGPLTRHGGVHGPAPFPAMQIDGFHRAAGLASGRGYIFGAEIDSGQIFRLRPDSAPVRTVLDTLDSNVRCVVYDSVWDELLVSMCCGQQYIVRYKMDLAGNIVARLGNIVGNGLNNPHGMVIDSRNRLVVANASSHTLSVFDRNQSGNYAPAAIVSGGELEFPIGVSVSPWGELFVANQQGNRLSRFLPDSSPNCYAPNSAQGPFNLVGNVQPVFAIFAPPTAGALQIPDLMWTPPASLVYGTRLSQSMLNAQATDSVSGNPVPGKFVYNPPLGTRLNAGLGQRLQVTFFPDDPSAYATASQARMLDVVTLSDDVTLFVTDAVQSRVERFRFASNGPALYAGGFNSPGPSGLAFSPSGELWVGNLTSIGGIHRYANPLAAVPTLAGQLALTTSPYGMEFEGDTLVTADFATPGMIRLSPPAYDTPSIIGIVDNTMRSYARNPLLGEYLIAECCGNQFVRRLLVNSAGEGMGFATPITGGGIFDAHNVMFNSRNEMLVANSSGESVSRFTQGLNGGFTAQSTVTGNGLSMPIGLVESPWGELLVANYNGATVSRFVWDGSQYVPNPIQPTIQFAPGASPTFLAFAPQMPRAEPVIQWVPATIAYGRTLDGTVLNATAADSVTGQSITGRFVYDPPAGTLLHVGAAQPLHVRFFPDDVATYESVEAVRTVNVAETSGTVTLFVPLLSRNRIERFQIPRTGAAIPLTGFDAHSPDAVAFEPDGKMWVSDMSGGAVRRFSNPMADPPVSDTNTSPVAEPGPLLYLEGALIVGDFQSGGLIRFTPPGYNTPQVLGVVSGYLRGFGLNPISRELLIPECCGIQQIRRLGLDPSGSPTGFQPPLTGFGLNNPHLAMFNSRNDILVANSSSDNVLRISQSAAGNPISLSTISGNGINSPIGMAISPWGELFVGNYGAGTISRFVWDGSGYVTNVAEPVITLAPGADPVYLAFAPQMSRAEPVIQWAPATIAYGRTLDGTVLNATAADSVTGQSITGRFVYDPPAGTLLHVGAAQPLHVRFYPDDVATYESVEAVRTVNVAETSGTVTLFVPLLSRNRIERYQIPRTGAAIPLTGFDAHSPDAVTFEPDGKMWVSDMSGGAVRRFSNPMADPPVSDTNTSPVAVPGPLLYLEGALIVGDFQSGGLIRFAPPGYNTPEVLGVVSGYLRGFGLNPITRELLIPECCGIQQVRRLGLDPSGSPTGFLPPLTGFGLNNPHLALFNSRNDILVANSSSDNVLRISQSASGNLISSSTISGNGMSLPIGMAISPWGELFVGNYGAGTISRFVWDGSGYLPNLAEPVITLAPGADPVYLAFAPQVARLTPVIQWPTPAAIAYGAALGETELNAVANDPVTGAQVDGSFAYLPPAGTVLDVGLGQVLRAEFTPIDSGSYSSVAATNLIDVTNTSTVLSLVGSPSASTAGDPVVFTATVAPAAATGTVKFWDGASLIGEAALNAGVASMTTSTLSLGTHSITAGYAGDSRFLGSSNTIAQLVKSTVTVVVRLIDSHGLPLAGGNVEYYQGSWQSAGTTGPDGTVGVELNGGNYNFAVTYAFGRNTKVQNIAANRTVTFQTVETRLHLSSSVGNPLSGAKAQYYAGAWRDIGNTDAQGDAEIELLPNSYNFAIEYAYGRLTKVQHVGVNSEVNFQTTLVSVGLSNSQAQPVVGAKMQYYAGGWRDIGLTGADGFARIELLADSYNFSVDYAFARQTKTQNVGQNSTVSFQTVLVTGRLLDSHGGPIEGAKIQYYGSGWRDIGLTDSAGEVRMELLGGNYNFSVDHGGARITKSQDVSADSAVVFQTVEVVAQLNSSTSTALAGGKIQYYAGGWRDAGVTAADGTVRIELLPVSYNFSVDYSFGRVTKVQNVASVPLVNFLTGRVHSNSGTCIQYYGAGWRTFTNDMELLPGNWNFKFSDGTPNTVTPVVLSTTNFIH